MASGASTAPLAGLRVLDLSTVVAGPFGAEVLGELGADVIRIEAPSPAAPPKTGPISEAEGFHWALARNKRAVAIDLKHPEGKALFLSLVANSDVVWDNFRPGVMQRLGFDHSALARRHPGIVSCSISGFGESGPWSRVGAYDITVQALSGAMAITGTGDPDAFPCRWGVPVGDSAGSLYAVIGVLAALEERSRTGLGQHIEVSLLDAQLSLHTYRVPQAHGAGMQFTAASPRRGGAGSVPYGPFRCGDGRWITIAVASNFWRAFCAVLGIAGLADEHRFASLALRQRNQRELDALLEEKFLERPAAAWDEAFVAAEVPAALIHDIAGAFAQAQAVARGMRVQLVDGEGREAPVAGSPLRFEGEATRAQLAPRATGADTESVLAEVVGLARSEIDRLAAAGAIGVARETRRGGPDGIARRVEQRVDTPSNLRTAIALLAALPGGPLAGTLVLELCGDEPSGTLGTQILGDLGATVIKLERLPAGTPAPVDSSTPISEALAYYWGLNRNKRSLAIDAKTTSGRALLHRLVKLADVVYDNFRPEVMRRIGADPQTLRGVNPSVILASVSGFGRSGPMAGKPAYDATIQALGGGMSLTGTGKETEPPVRFGNPIGGIAGALYAVTGILAALARRRRTAAGATLDISLLDSQLALHAYRVPPALGAGVRYGPTPHRGGSGALPYGPFRARCGRWFALGITNQFWPAFCNLAGHPKWISDPRFASEALRQANEQALNRAVGETIATRDAEDWQERFIEAGIPGATVRSIPEAFRHPHVAERRMLVSFDHPLGSRLKVAGNPIKLSRHADARFSPAPSLGADTRRVLQDLLDMKSDELDQFCHDRVIWWPEHGEVYERPSVV